MSDEAGRRLLDENGRIFGLVNVVDALVVLLVLAVVVAGLALLLPSEGEPETRYATLDMGDQPDYIAEQITPGDEWEPVGTSDSITITDVYRYNTGNGTAVIARAQVNGTLYEPADPDAASTFEFRGEPLRLGQSFTLVTQDYELSADVTNVHRSGETLPISDAEFVFETTVSPETAAELDVGDEFTAGGDVFGEITAIELYPSGEERYVLVGLSATTLERGGSQFIGDTRISVGAPLSFNGDGYDIDGEVVRRGSLAEFGTHATQTVTIRLENISPERADALSEGMTEQTRDRTTAQVQSVTTQPAEIVLESEDGDIFLREHPRNKDVELTIELAVRELDDGTVRFRGETLRGGQTVMLELDGFTIEGEVIRLQG